MSSDICKKYPYLNVCRGEAEQRVFKARDRVASGKPSRRPEVPKRTEEPRTVVEDFKTASGTRPFVGPRQGPPSRPFVGPRQATARRDFRPVQSVDELGDVPARDENGRRNRNHKPISIRNVGNPDIQTVKFVNDVRKKVGAEREKFLKKLDLGTKIVEHPPEEILNSYLAEAAYRNAYKSTNKAEEFVQNGKDLVPELEFMEVVRDPRFTNNEHIAFRNTRTGKSYISYRGSDADFFKPEANVESVIRGKAPRMKNAADWGTNLHTIGGKEHLTERYRGAVNVAREFAEFEGIPVEQLGVTGHSLGGGQADHVSEVTGAKSYSSVQPVTLLLPGIEKHHTQKVKSNLSRLFSIRSVWPEMLMPV